MASVSPLLEGGSVGGFGRSMGGSILVRMHALPFGWTGLALMHAFPDVPQALGGGIPAKTTCRAAGQKRSLGVARRSLANGC